MIHNFGAGNQTRGDILQKNKKIQYTIQNSASIRVRCIVTHGEAIATEKNRY